MKILVSIILLNYNGKQFNKDCIDSILAQNYQDFEIIFVDQCSTDGSLEEVETLYENEIKNGRIKIVKNTENNGFTGGNNLGVKHADSNSKYICLLNNDTTVPNDWLEKLILGIESDNELGAVSCLILNKGFEEKILDKTFNKKQKSGGTVFGEWIFLKMKGNEIKSKICYTNQIGGCCLLYKKEIIEQPFPEYYFAYAEDVYLSRFIICKGYKIGLCLSTQVNHYGSGSFGNKPSPLKLFHGNKNQILNYLLFYPLIYKILLFPLFLTKEISHLFMGSPLLRLEGKIQAIKRIKNNWNKIQLTKDYIKKNKKISYYSFYKNLSYKLVDTYNVDTPILKILVFIGNLIFFIYNVLLTPFFFLINLIVK